MLSAKVPCFCLLLILTLNACVSLVENAGKMLDGSAFAEKTLAVYENRETDFGVRVSRKLVKPEGPEYLLIEFDAFPTLGIRASAPDKDHRIVLETLEFLSPNQDGWNEFSRELSGEGRFKDEYYVAFLSLREAPEVLDISAGRIRRNSARITGDAALTFLRNRQERIDTLTVWMASYLETHAPSRRFADQKAFEDFWAPVLFPEMVKAKKRPPEWTAATSGGRRQGRWQRGEDINWSVDYTEALFPEGPMDSLRPVRDSGTLLRDWEEALPWIFYQFEWDAIMASLLPETRLSKVR
jgi:hypothetical protein